MKEVLISQQAKGALSKLPAGPRRRAREAIEKLMSGENLEAVPVLVVRGKTGELWLAKVDRYRMIYQMDRTKNSIQILDIFIPEESANDTAISDFLRDYLTEEVIDDLDSLSSHTIVEDVEDVVISARIPEGAAYRVVGSGSVTVQLNYGGGEERDGVTSYSSYPFTFEVLVDEAGEPLEVKRLEVDTSEFYE